MNQNITRKAFLGTVTASLVAFTVGCSDDESGEETNGMGGAAGAAEAPISERQIELVQSTWEDVKNGPGTVAAAEIFYDLLLEDNEEIAALFENTDFEEQGVKLMEMLGAAVDGLNDLESLVPILENLGASHVNYGVKFEHFTNVGAALLATLELGLGEGFTEEVQEAWTAVYTVVSGTMIAGGGFEPES